MAKRRFVDRRDYREVKANARGSWRLSLIGAALVIISIVLAVPGGKGIDILTTVFAILFFIGGVALLYVGSSLRRDALKAQLRHDETNDPWADKKAERG